jgi:hypothetical protein
VAFANSFQKNPNQTNLTDNDKIDVLVADPGGTKSNLNANETSQKFFLTRWCSNFVGAMSGARRNPEDAVGSILYALSDPDLKNGTFIRFNWTKRE